jgi:hypothetical protein
MPLTNRVTPFGELIATPARGTLMGNRGGRLHDADKKLTARRWTNRQWICCVLDFHGRHRDVWGESYTELFFLDEVTAFAAGHRPCFECRRQDAAHFATLFSGTKARARAPDMDRVLHAERLANKEKRLHRRALDTLPDGAMLVREGEPYAVRGKHLLHWTPAGYDRRVSRPRKAAVDVLTPPAILAVLAAGYAPRWHPSAVP